MGGNTMLISVTLTHTHSIKLLALVLLQFINFLFVLDVFCFSSQKNAMAGAKTKQERDWKRREKTQTYQVRNR